MIFKSALILENCIIYLYGRMEDLNFLTTNYFIIVVTIPVTIKVSLMVINTIISILQFNFNYTISRYKPHMFVMDSHHKVNSKTPNKDDKPVSLLVVLLIMFVEQLLQNLAFMLPPTRFKYNNSVKCR